MKGYNFYHKKFRQLKVGDVAYKVNLYSRKVSVVKVEEIKLLYTQDPNRLTMARIIFSDGNTFEVGANFSNDYTKHRDTLYTTERSLAYAIADTFR